MSLPKIDLPIYDVKLPSTGKEIKIRPFTVKEEKLLLMAAESNDTQEIINTTKQIINNCLIDKVKIDTLPFFDIDYLFIALRAKSIGESIEMRFTCNNVVEDKICNHMFYADINISNCEVIVDESIATEITVGKGIQVKLKYPSYNIMKTLSENENVLEKKIKIMSSCIDMVVDGEKVHSSKDYTREELSEFIESLTEEDFKKFELFVDNFPYFVVASDVQCSKCGFNHHIQYTNFESFFQ